MTLYLEQYLDSLQGLPGDLKTNLSLLRDLDGQCQAKLFDIDGKVKRFVKSWRNMTRESRKKKYDNIQREFSEAKDVSDKKISLASSTYEMVDKHIRRLDSDLARFEADIKRRLLGAASDDESVKRGRKTPVGKKDRKRPLSGDGKKRNKKSKIDDADEDQSPTSPIGKMDPASAEHLASLSGTALFQQLAGGSAEVDMPVDPNEPTYCICHQ
uniref:Inhibitor of growth protein N-terminal histone-binding domain-containing protein n=2 Tax=Plectus sambesii TaxID=2011161 RepID=A0A914XDN6_9BILA